MLGHTSVGQHAIWYQDCSAREQCKGSMVTRGAQVKVASGRIVQESMRVRPVVPMLFRQAMQDVRLGEFLIPAGTILVRTRRLGSPDIAAQRNSWTFLLPLQTP